MVLGKAEEGMNVVAGASRFEGRGAMVVEDRATYAGVWFRNAPSSNGSRPLLLKIR